MKVICLHHRLGGFTSHHFNEAHGFKREFARRGIEFVLLVNARAQPHIVAELGAKAVFDDPTFRLEWSFDERSRRFADMLHKHIDPIVKADDRLLVTIATQLEAHALIRWSQELPREKRPWIVILFVSDRWNRAGRDEYERQVLELRQVAASIAKLSAEEASRLILLTLTDPLAEELAELLGTKVTVAPIPLEYGDPDMYRAAPRQSRPHVAVLGGTRREKGSHLIPDIIRATRPLVDVQFVVELANDNLSADDAAKLAAVAGEPNVKTIRDPMTLAQYNIVLNGAEIVLLPYEQIPYRKRGSGVFAEALAYGKPVVVTCGTWMAQQIEAGRAAGTIADDFQPDSFARAIARCVANLKTLQESAQAASAEWRRSSLSTFVDLIETQIGGRASAAT